MLITCTIVASSTTATSQFDENLTIKLQGLSDNKRLPNKSLHIYKGPNIKSKDNCDLPQNY